MKGPLKSLWVIPVVQQDVNAALAALDADDVVSANALFFEFTRAPVNTGDFWITEDTPAEYPSCLEEDFGFCPLPMIDFWIDEYGQYGGTQAYKPNTFLATGDEYADGTKILYDYNQYARNKLVAIDYSGDVVETLHNYSDVQTPPIPMRYIGAMRGNVRLMLACSTEGAPYGRPLRPLFLINNEDFPPGAGVVHRFADISGSTTAKFGMHYSPMVYKNGYLYGMAASIVTGGADLVRWEVPRSGYDYGDSRGRWVLNVIPVDAVSTDPLLTEITIDGQGGANRGICVTLSDDGRMFGVVYQSDSRGRYIVEFDENMEAVQSWDFDSVTALQIYPSLSSQTPNIGIAANRILVPRYSQNPLLYELSDDGSIDIVHEWTTADLGGGFAFGYVYDPVKDGIMRAFAYDPGQPIVTHYLINYNGTPDYTP